MSLVAVDPIFQPLIINANIQASILSAGSGLAEGQLIEYLRMQCTNLTFNIVSLVI